MPVASLPSQAAGFNLGHFCFKVRRLLPAGPAPAECVPCGRGTLEPC